MLAILLLIIIALLYGVVMPKYAGVVRKSIESKTEYVISSFNSTFDKLNRLMYIIYTDKELTQNFHSESEIDVMEGISTLKKYKSEYDAIDEIIILYSDQSDYFTSSGAVKRENYAEINSVVDKISKCSANDNLYITVNSGEKSGMLMGKRVKSTLPYYKEMTVIYRLLPENIDKSINSLYGEDSGQLFVLADNKEYFSVGENLYNINDVLSKYKNEKNGKNGGTFAKDGVLYHRSDYGKLSYISVVPEKNILKGYFRLQGVVFIVLILMAGIGVLLCIRFSRLNYKPMARIYSMVKTRGGVDEEQNEFDSIQSFVSSLLDKNEQLSTTVNFQERHIIRQTMLIILSGEFEDEQQARNLIKNTGLNLNGSFAAVIISGTEAGEDDEHSLCEAVCVWLKENNAGYAVEILNREFFVAVINIDGLKNKSRDGIISGINDMIIKEFGIKAKFFPGEVCSELSKIKLSYKQAISLYEEKQSVAAIDGNETDRSQEQRLYVEVIKYINENYRSSDLSLNLISENTGKSIYYISRLIKANMGCTFIDYVSNLRIAYAKNMLAKTDKKISDIVAETGYLNVSAFNKKFKKIVGENPTNYRRDNQKL